MKKLKDFITEMPHISTDKIDGMDLQIEKYDIPSEEKKRLMQAFFTVGVCAFSEIDNLWYHITSEGFEELSKPITDFILPDTWESYIRFH